MNSDIYEIDKSKKTVAPNNQSSETLNTAITLPKGGGAIKGIDEKFSVNAANGTCALSFHLPVSPARQGFSPSLSLSYNSGSGNSPFGLGLSLSVSSISLNTDKGLPKYDGDDTFMFTGAEDLIPCFSKAGDTWLPYEEEREEAGIRYKIQRYRPRIEGIFARIEQWKDVSSGIIHWRAINRSNITSIYGKNTEARIADSEDEKKIYKWFIEFSFDDKGNCILYRYKPENLAGVNASNIHEKNRVSGLAYFSNLYLKRVSYGNKTPFKYGDALPEFMFDTIFDYGEHDSDNPTPIEKNAWHCRIDPFSSYRSGFEIRTYRLCRRVLLFHNFEELGRDPCLVSTIDFSYETDKNFTYLKEITRSGYIRSEDGSYRKKSFPPFSLDYEKPVWNKEIKTLEEEAFIHFPQGIDNQNYQWMDLYGEGISGILTEQDNAWYYKRNLGEGNFSQAALIAEKPSLSGVSTGEVVLQSLEANGKRFLISKKESIPGYYEMMEDATWLPFQSFTKIPNLDYNASQLKYIDLTGDGKPDLFFSEDELFCWYQSKGKEGFDRLRKVVKVLDEEKGPRMIFSDNDNMIALADMSGDGLCDIVRVRNGEIAYWPNQGYGRFGAKVTMSNPPHFSSESDFNPQYLRLFDLDGSGTTDIVYSCKDGIRAWLNLSGNFFSEEILIDGLPNEGKSSLAIFDLLGTGTGSIVWSSPLPRDSGRPLKYIDLFKGKKPHLLKSYKNNMGKEVFLSYKTSTYFYLKDKRDGRPWVTRLPFPVHCLSKVETIDRITNTQFATEYSYHHGYYDNSDREFRGFGRVDTIDCETFEHFVKRDAANVVEEPLHQPPVLTKTWYHTGAFLDKVKILSQFANEYYQNTDFTEHQLPESVLPEDLTIEEWREAIRCLKGMPLRSEVYGLDDTDREKHPYTVTQNNASVQILQPKLKNKHAVFLVTGSESVSYHYEREPTDPRISHTLNLEMDNLGNIIKSATVVYPRRIKNRSLPQIVQEEQDKFHIVYNETDFTNDINSEVAYRLRLPYEKKSYEVTGLVSSGELFNLGELRQAIAEANTIPHEAEAGDSVQKRLISQERTLYLKNNLSGPSRLGVIESLGLSYENYTLSLTPDLMRDIYGEKADESMLLEGGYVHSEGDENWWIPSGTSIYPDEARNHFYMPVGEKDPFGNKSSVEYDSYKLLVKEIEDAIGNKAKANNDYRLLMPVLVWDLNKNRTQIETDELGMVVKLAVLGKEGKFEGDTLEEPTTITRYEMDNFWKNGKPNFVHSKNRESHGNSDSFWQEAYAYSDGSGNLVMAKVQAEPGVAQQADSEGNVRFIDTTPDIRWIGNGRTILNNKGNPVKKYEPYFSVNSDYEDEEVLVETGVTPVMYYDPLGRLIKTENPDGTLSMVEFTPWMQKSYDANDTVLESNWYRERGRPDPGGTEPNDPERRAAFLAAKHADTPMIVHMDSLGRPFYNIADNGNRGKHVVWREFDLKNQVLKTFDARKNAASYKYTISGEKGYQHNNDSGTRISFRNVKGNPIFAWNAKNGRFRMRYDKMGRLIERWIKENEETESLAEKIIYGDSLEQALDLNLRGEVYKRFDQSGIIVNEGFDFKGNVLSIVRTFIRDYKSTIDWNVADESLLLSAECFRRRREYDALGRVRKEVTPHTDGMIASEIVPVYNERGLIRKIELFFRGSMEKSVYIQDIQYSAKSQTEKILYGNGLLTRYHYDEKSFKLRHAVTSRNGGGIILQDLEYFYDPVGNLTEIRDGAQQTIFFNGQVVKPFTKYEYDALYRLISSQGREHIGQNVPITQKDDFRRERSHPEDGQAMRNYTQRYEYDEGDNILSLAHSAGRNSWERIFNYGETNNRLLSTQVGDVVDSYSYDEHGCTLNMSHLQNMEWDVKDRLRRVQRQAARDEEKSEKAYYIYNYTDKRTRKVMERENGTIKEERFYVGEIEVYRKYNATGDIVLERETLHITAGSEKIAMLETTLFSEGELVENPSSLTRYQLSNHLKSVALETNSDGEIISYEEYYPFGSTAYHAVNSRIEANPKRYRYMGMERDEESGFNYHGSRYYAPWLGRWISCDPLHQHRNLYVGMGNSPPNRIDLDGNYDFDWAAEAAIYHAHRDDPEVLENFEEHRQTENVCAGLGVLLGFVVILGGYSVLPRLVAFLRANPLALTQIGSFIVGLLDPNPVGSVDIPGPADDAGRLTGRALGDEAPEAANWLVRAMRLVRHEETRDAAEQLARHGDEAQDVARTAARPGAGGGLADEGADIVRTAGNGGDEVTDLSQRIAREVAEGTFTPGRVRTFDVGIDELRSMRDQAWAGATYLRRVVGIVNLRGDELVSAVRELLSQWSRASGVGVHITEAGRVESAVRAAGGAAGDFASLNTRPGFLQIEEQLFTNAARSEEGARQLLREVSHELSLYYSWQHVGGLGRAIPSCMGHSLMNALEQMVPGIWH